MKGELDGLARRYRAENMQKIIDAAASKSDINAAAKAARPESSPGPAAEAAN